MTDFKYVGSELEIFRHATNWKNYYSRIICSYLGNKVLEVGAGVGATTKLLCKGTEDCWICLEPDLNLSTQIKKMILKTADAIAASFSGKNKSELIMLARLNLKLK